MAWTTPKTWAVGEQLTAGNFNPHIRDNLNALRWLGVRKTADETVNNSTVLQNDDHLFFSVAANEVWIVDSWLRVVGSQTADVSFAWAVPAGATGSVYAIGEVQSGGSIDNIKSYTTITQPFSYQPTATDANTGGGVRFGAVLVVGGTGGTMQLQWAQASAVVANTVVKANSALWAFRVV